MLMVICMSLRRLRSHHVNLNATRTLWHSHLQHLQRSIYGQNVYRLAASRHYVQAPEARPVPDDRSPPGLQQQQPAQPTQEKHLQQQQEQHLQQQQQVHLTLSSHSLKTPTDKPDIQTKDTMNSPSTSMSAGIQIPYPIDWIFPRLRNPSGLWYVASQIVITIVGVFSKIVLVLMNKTQVLNKERLIKAVSKRPKGIPLLTVSNHYSCFDDPGVWGIMPMRYVCNTFRIRWAMAAHDICFTRKLHSMFFMFGKCIPVVRGYGVYQEAINLCIEKCALGHWVHVFPEGKVNMNKEELRLKWGVGRIVYESPRIPIILPMWHEGMDDVLPNVEPYKLQRGKKVTINIGKPLDLGDFVQNLKDTQVSEIVARKLITDKIQDAFRDLRSETERIHGERA